MIRPSSFATTISISSIANLTPLVWLFGLTRSNRAAQTLLAVRSDGSMSARRFSYQSNSKRPDWKHIGRTELPSEAVRLDHLLPYCMEIFGSTLRRCRRISYSYRREQMHSLKQTQWRTLTTSSHDLSLSLNIPRR